MEILITIAPILIVGVVSYFIISIQEWITDVRFYRRKTQRELDKIRRSLGKITLPTGEEQILGSGVIEKVGKVTCVVDSLLRNNEELEEMSEAEKLIKEAKEKQI